MDRTIFVVLNRGDMRPLAYYTQSVYALEHICGNSQLCMQPVTLRDDFPARVVERRKREREEALAASHADTNS